MRANKIRLLCYISARSSVLKGVRKMFQTPGLMEHPLTTRRENCRLLASEQATLEVTREDAYPSSDAFVEHRRHDWHPEDPCCICACPRTRMQRQARYREGTSGAALRLEQKVLRHESLEQVLRGWECGGQTSWFGRARHSMLPTVLTQHI